jgi:iron complex transport system ATP-binding protein
MTTIALQIHGLSVGYRVARATRTVLNTIDAALHTSEFACLLGPNGVGKSTLLRTLARMQSPIAGQVDIDGHDIRRMNQTELARRLSVVLTERVDVGILPAYDLVGMGRYPYTGWGGRLSQRDHEIIRWAIRVTGAESLATRNVAELSDGERQRVMIARALAQEPSVMLLDEPTAFLDAPRRAELTGLLRQLTRETGRAVLLSTHDVELALRTADTIWLITPDGQFIAGAPEDLVLRGVFERAFPSANFAFDPMVGGFQVRHAHARRARIHGNGLVGLWTRRALERAGFVPIDEADSGAVVDLDVRCVQTSAGWCWQTVCDMRIHDHASLAELTRHLHRSAPADIKEGTSLAMQTE